MRSLQPTGKAFLLAVRQVLLQRVYNIHRLAALQCLVFAHTYTLLVATVMLQCLC